MIDFEKVLKEKLSEETFKIISSSEKEFGDWLDRLKQGVVKCGELQSEVEELRKLKEKQEPKKPVTYERTNRADCPICRATVRGIDKPFGDWCSNCGQAIDWS